MSHKGELHMQQLLCLGDSITDCERLASPDGLGYGYVHLVHQFLNQKHPWKTTNRGVNGFTLNRVLESLRYSFPHNALDAVTLLIGINDVGLWMANPSVPLFHQVTQFRLTLTKLLKILSQSTASIYLLEPFIFPYPEEYLNWFEPLSAVSQTMEELCATYQARFIPLHKQLNHLASQVGYPVLTTDGIHLTPAGHRIIAAKLIENWEDPA